MMDFSMHFFRKKMHDWASVYAACVWLLAVLCLSGIWGAQTLAHAADARAVDAPAVQAVRLSQSEGAVHVNASLHFDLPARAQDALQRGIPVYFVERIRVVKPRWYWADRTVVEAVRYMRLSYQPLIRKWRLNTSSTAFSSPGQGMSLGQNFEDLADALAVLQRISNWAVEDKEQLVAGDRYAVELEFKLDLSQLPRPLQIGALGRSGWDLSVTHRQEWAPLASPVE